MGVELLRKYVSSSMRICYRSVVRHPFLVGMVFLLISMYRLFPLLFSLLVYASPVIVSTAVLLGTLLSFGQPNIPEIEKERDEVQNSETKVMSHSEIVGRDGSSASEEANGSRTEVGDKSFGEKTSVNDDNPCVEVNRPVGLVDDGVFKSEKLQFREEHVIDEAKSESANQGTDVDEEKVVLGNDYSPLQQSEDENAVLESDDKLREGSADPLHSDSGLLWKHVEGDDYEDVEGSDSGSDLAESSSPDASMADIIPMLDELHPLLAEEREAPQPTHMSHDGMDAASEHSLESSDSSSESNDDHGIANHEDLEVGDDEDKESKHTDKEDETRSAITWTEDDQKNLMNLGTSELERNQRLENLIARRRARKAMRMQAEKNLIDLESADLPWNVRPISTARNNPFDISYDSNDNIPGSAPSVLLPRRNPFDLPYDSSEEKPDLVGDTFQQEFAAFQPKEAFFRRHENFNVGPSIFGASRQERQETKLRPYFVPEQVAFEGTSFSSFQRQLSELSDSKVSSVPDTESIDSAGDLENKDHIEDDLSREAELTSEKEHEHASEIREHPELISKGKHAPEARLHVSEHVSQGSQSSEGDGNVESIQVAEGGDRLDEAKISVGNVTDQQEVASDFPETENVASSTELMSHSTHLNLGDQELHSSASSLSLSDEVSEQIYNEKEGDEMRTSVSETTYYFVDRGNSIEKSDIDITNLVVEESQPKEPIYDSSPRAVTKNLSSSSISTDLQPGISERGQSPPTLERTSSFSGRKSQETVQKIETDYPGNDAEFVDSSERDAAEDIGSRSIRDHNLNESELNLGPSVGEDHLPKDKSFQHTNDQLQSSSSVADVKGDSTDSSPETKYAEDQISMVPDNEEPLFAADNISMSLPNKPLPETEDSLLDTEASHQLEQDQVPSSNCQARSHEDNHEEEVISQPEESSLLDRSMDKPSAEDPEELQACELERGQVASSSSEAQFHEVVHGETYENLDPIHHQFVSEKKAISQPEKDFPLSDTSVNKPSKETLEVLQVQISSNNSDNLQIQEPENNVSLNINSASSAEPDVVEVAGIETKLPENPAFVSDIHRIENNNVPDNTDDVDEIKEIDENLLVELDAVGDFSVKDLGSTLNEMKQDPHALEHDLETNRSGDEDSYSKDLGSPLIEMKQDPHASEHDLETNRSGDEDSYFKDLGSPLIEMKQDPHASEHDLETNRSGDEDSYFKDLGSTLNEMKQDPHASEHDLETNRSGDEDSYPKDLGSTLNDMKQDPHASEHDLETNRSGDEDSYSKDLGSTLIEMKQDPHALEHDLETNRSGDDSYSKDLGSTLNEMKQDPHDSEHDLETNHSRDEDSYSTVVCETKIKMHAEDIMKSQNEKEIGKTEAVGASEAEISRTMSINDANEVVLARKTESSAPGSTSTSPTTVN